MSTLPENMTYKWKCRMCGETFGSLVSSGLNIQMGLIELCLRGKINKPNDAFASTLRLVHVHNCADGRMGIADMIGAMADG